MEHDKCSMRVNTDAVLLGAWASIPVVSTPIRVLDIGTGSGVIALMMAQRMQEVHCSFEVTAIDIDAASVVQAAENFRQSVWSERMEARCQSLQDLATTASRYDCIVSNPPYFVHSLKNPNPTRMAARHTDSLSYEELMASSARLLNAEGLFSLILPAEAEDEIVRLGAENGLTPMHITHVYSKPQRPRKRLLITLQKRHTGHSPMCRTQTFYIALEDSSRSPEYEALTTAFYL